MSNLGSEEVLGFLTHHLKGLILSFQKIIKILKLDHQN